jgi:hypothetical protein
LKRPRGFAEVFPKNNNIIAVIEGGGKMGSRKLELVFVDKNGKWYPLDEVNSEELAEGLKKISKETAKRLLLQKQQR